MAYKDKEKQRQAQRRHYLLHKKDYNRRARIGGERIRRRISQFIVGYLSQHPCVDCGENNIIVLEFDHVRGKKCGNVGNLKTYSLGKVIREIEKCEVRCANCHRIVTHKRRLSSRSGETGISLGSLPKVPDSNSGSATTLELFI
jgi:hypothetical protein